MSNATEQELSRIDELLMRVLDEEATSDERQELLALADADARLTELSELRLQLRDAVFEWSDDAVEVVGAVMAALQMDDGWDALSEGLRDAFTAEALAFDGAFEGAFDVSEAVMAAVAPVALAAAEEAPPEAVLSALHDGELSAERRVEMARVLGADRSSLSTLTDYADIGRLVREGLQNEARHADLSPVWRSVAPAIGLSDPEEVPGWAPISDALREAVAAASVMSAAESVALADAVMDGIPNPVRDLELAHAQDLEELVNPSELRGWIVRLIGPAAILALGLLLVIPKLSQVPETVDIEPTPPVAENTESEGNFEAMTDGGAIVDGLAAVQVESLETADDVFVQVMQFDDDGPLFLMIDDAEEPSAPDDGASL